MKKMPQGAGLKSRCPQQMKNSEDRGCGSLWVNILILLIEAVKSIGRTKSNGYPKRINGLTGRMRGLPC